MAPPNASMKRLAAKTSEIWSHFRDLQGGVVECNACKHKIASRGNNVSSSVQMWLHLRSNHKDIFAATEYFKRRQAIYASQSASATSQALNVEGRSPFYREGSRFDAITTLKLEKLYKQQRCPALEARQRLAARWKVPLASINGWFGKRRLKDRVFAKKPLSKPSKAAAEANENNAGEAIAGANDAAPLSEPSEDANSAATGSNLGKAANAKRPGILKRYSGSSNTASPAASGAIATPQSAERKKVKFNEPALRAEDKIFCGGKQRIDAVGRSEIASAAAGSPSCALSGHIITSTRPSLPHIPRVAQATHFDAAVDQDIVEASGQAIILRLKTMYAKSPTSFLRALHDIDNEIFKHEMWTV